MAVRRGLAVVAIGGNSLIKDRFHQDVHEQYMLVRETCTHLASMVENGWDMVVGHGNGPQVGFILRRSELAAHELHELPLDVCGADTQGAIGYALAQNLQNELRTRGIHKPVAAIVTQTEVDRDDAAFARPSKPIGSFMDDEQASRRRDEDGWQVVQDANRGWRRVVPSPRPLRIVEIEAIQTMVRSGAVLVAVGGGGIPVAADEHGDLRGVEAVIDKDLGCSLLARELGADLFLITTAVEKVALNFGTPEERRLDSLSLSEAKQYLAEGIHFAKGSMAPKIQAVVEYLEGGGKQALITDPANIERALAGETGTRFALS
ncbi:MAG TPA: carbamate kinase [Acidimicrobiales bacterium]|nr:carbamate kinase [Acidimicrobiales bacterium]